MEFRRLVELPIPQSGCGDTRVTADGLSLLVEYEYRKDASDLIGGIRFRGLIAYRFRNEFHSGGYPPESYESIAEAVDSPWLEELAELEPASLREAETKHHYAAFLSSNGCLEVAADTFEVIPPRCGVLSVSDYTV
ncbi:MAG TPA: hypothetical protein VEZ90_09755 [Blastocatellia bacterium]|nr:hypothetical protein [Blastocatellia bacterium]